MYKLFIMISKVLVLSTHIIYSLAILHTRYILASALPQTQVWFLGLLFPLTFNLVG